MPFLHRLPIFFDKCKLIKHTNQQNSMYENEAQPLETREQPKATDKVARHIKKWFF